MGEAKRRKAQDPNYGKPKRGLVVSPPLEITGTQLLARSTNLDPQELRFALLFWDKLVWPSSRAIHFASGPNEQFLETAGVLSRPEYTVWGYAAQGIAQGQIQAFLDLDKREPGVWSLAQGANSLLLKDNKFQAGGGAFVELCRAIPVPDKDVPLQEILDFKERRRSELECVRANLDKFLKDLLDAGDKDGILALQVSEIDAACADALRVGKEWKFPVRLSNVKASFELRPFATLAGAIGGWATGGALGMPLSASAIGALTATAPCLKISGDLGIQAIRPRQGPYRYVSQFHSELF